MVNDAGHWNHDAKVFNLFEEFIGKGDIDLLITSHCDSDHLAATDELFNRFDNPPSHSTTLVFTPGVQIVLTTYNLKLTEEEEIG